MTCCLSGATALNPGCSQSCCCCGDGGAGSMSTFLNTIGRWGTVVAGQVSGKPVQVTPRGGVTVGPSAQYAAQKSNSQLMFFVLIAALAAILFFAFKK